MLKIANLMQNYHEERGRTEIYNCIIRRWEKSVNENRVLRVNESQDCPKKGERGAFNCPPPPQKKNKKIDKNR